MKYKIIYDALVKRAKDEEAQGKRNEGYFEKHHILPKSLNGTNDETNLVKLTYREHFIAHLLLIKIFLKDPVSHRKMVFALWRMVNGKHKIKNASKVYERTRKEFVNVMKGYNSIRQKGENNSQFGKKWYTNRDSGECKSFDFKPDDRWVAGRFLFRGESSDIRKTILRDKCLRLSRSKEFWNEYHSGNYSSIRDFCRKRGYNLHFVTCLLREVPLFSKVFKGRSKNNISRKEYINHFEE